MVVMIVDYFKQSIGPDEEFSKERYLGTGSWVDTINTGAGPKAVVVKNTGAVELFYVGDIRVTGSE